MPVFSPLFFSSSFSYVVLAGSPRPRPDEDLEKEGHVKLGQDQGQLELLRLVHLLREPSHPADHEDRFDAKRRNIWVSF